MGGCAQGLDGRAAAAFPSSPAAGGALSCGVTSDAWRCPQAPASRPRDSTQQQPMAAAASSPRPAPRIPARCCQPQTTAWEARPDQPAAHPEHLVYDALLHVHHHAARLRACAHAGGAQWQRGGELTSRRAPAPRARDCARAPAGALCAGARAASGRTLRDWMRCPAPPTGRFLRAGAHAKRVKHALARFARRADRRRLPLRRISAARHVCGGSPGPGTPCRRGAARQPGLQRPASCNRAAPCTTRAYILGYERLQAPGAAHALGAGWRRGRLLVYPQGRLGARVDVAEEAAGRRRAGGRGSSGRARATHEGAAQGACKRRPGGAAAGLCTRLPQPPSRPNYSDASQ